MKTSLYIDVPSEFSFRSTLNSHGWSGLRPFELDDKNWRLGCVLSLPEDGPVHASISEETQRLRIDLDRKMKDDDALKQQIRHILRLDDDLGDFYRVIMGNPRLGWVVERRAGRLLRSSTVFEDLVKTICTTNCSWGLTKAMVTNLVEKLGEPVLSKPARSRGRSLSEPAKFGESMNNEAVKHAFPTPQIMASVGPEFYRDEIRAGYRSQYFVELAESVASGRLDPEKWLHSDLPTPELKKEMKKVKGVGDYAAENLLKLVGHYDGLALDSWLRAQFYKHHNKEQTCPDKVIERHYAKYGRWRGLVIWCDMTERWIAET
jgi:3-methyladenine DNA glycosylase/8-oxoguanine DNA glycosylase